MVPMRWKLRPLAAPKRVGTTRSTFRCGSGCKLICDGAGGLLCARFKSRAPYGAPVDNPPGAQGVERVVPTRWPALGIAAATAAVYANTLRVPFLFDDRSSILENPTLNSWATAFFPPHGGGTTVEGRPFLNATFALNHWLSGDRVWSYHALNLGIHLCAALLLLALLARSLPILTAFAAALVWTVHPLCTEAVTYIAQRAESLASCLCLLTLYAFARWSDTCRDDLKPAGGAQGPPALVRHRWAVLAWSSCFVGMGVKETMYSTPLLVLLYDRAFLSGTWAEAWRRHRGMHGALWACLPVLALVMTGAGSRGHTVGFGSGIGEWTYVQTEFHSLAHYLSLCFWPAPLIFDYGAQWFSGRAVAADALLVLGLLALTLAGLFRFPRAAFLGCVFFLILAPTTLVPGNRQTSAEHRMYLPLAAVIALAAIIVEAASRRFVPAGADPAAARRPVRLPMILFALAALPLGAAAIARNHAYRSAESLYRSDVARLPGNVFAHYDLGVALQAGGDWAGAAAQYRATLQLDPGMVHAAADLGGALRRLGDWPGAEAAYRQALELNPNDAAVRFALGLVLQKEGRAPEAAEQFNDAQLLDPGYRTRREAP